MNRLTLLLTMAAFVLAVPVAPFLYAQDQTPTPSPDDIPEPAPLLDEGEYDILNILLLGSDTTNPRNAGRTDVILVVSINRTAQTVAMLSIPRDLYVYIPDHRVYRINSAFGYGQTESYAGGGAQLLMDTIEYNLGLHIDHYARVDFNDFRQIVNDIGGVEVAVDCALQDWRLREPDLDPTLEDNWEMFTLPVGVHQMDGDLALWYARSRRTSSDFDRGRRHQVLMRAIWQRVRSLNLVEQLTDIWPQTLELVETDIPLDTMIGLAPMALTIDTSRIASYMFRQNHEVISWRSPEGSSVLVPERDVMMATLRDFLLPVTEQQLIREHAVVEVVNASGWRGMARVAAERLAWEGFVPQISNDSVMYQDYTVIYDYTGQSKGSSLGVLQSALRVSDGQVRIEPDPNRTVDFRVVLGGQYYACTYAVAPPEAPTEADAAAGD